MDKTVVLLSRMETSAETYTKRRVEKLLASVGNYTSVERLLSKYAKVNTKRGYLFQLDRYFRWLREDKGVRLNYPALKRGGSRNP